MELCSMNYDQFSKHVIAQDDDCDYSESGYVAVVVGSEAGVSRYSHCSCYGTFSCLVEGSTTGEYEKKIRYDWTGSVDQLLKMARNISDVSMPDRKADPEDYDYDHLCNMYSQVISWAESRNKE